VISGQLSLLGRGEPSVAMDFARAQRTELGAGAWVDYAPGFVDGHAELFETLSRTTRWRRGQEQMYDRLVDAPRVFASIPDDGPGHPVLDRVRRALEARYQTAFPRLSLAMYRDGKDSVAWHGDRVARRMEQTLVASISVGAPRRLLLRPYGGGASVGFRLGWGDLFVMGGTCQRTWQHSVPKVAHAEPRIAIMFRPLWEE
jgi:alkylated DNA repair dioxygenase AlkB